MGFSGAKLKEIRLQKGLTLEEVHKITKIHPNILKAIEEDSLINLSPVYIKGFLKIYCRFLGVEAAEFIPASSIAQAPLHYTPDKEEKSASLVRKTFLRPPSFLKKIKLKPVIILILAILAVFALFKFGKFIASHAKPALKKSPVLAVQRDKLTKNEVTSAKQKIPPSPVIRLTIHARDKCYLVLKNDGRVVFRGDLRKGMSESWQAKQKIEFSANNPASLDLDINGKLVSGLGRKVKSVTITKEGLNITR